MVFLRERKLWPFFEGLFYSLQAAQHAHNTQQFILNMLLVICFSFFFFGTEFFVVVCMLLFAFLVCNSREVGQDANVRSAIDYIGNSSRNDPLVLGVKRERQKKAYREVTFSFPISDMTQIESNARVRCVPFQSMPREKKKKKKKQCQRLKLEDNRNNGRKNKQTLHCLNSSRHANASELLVETTL